MTEKVVYNKMYQLPLILSALLHTDLISVGYLTTFVFIRSLLDTFYPNRIE